MEPISRPPLNAPKPDPLLDQIDRAATVVVWAVFGAFGAMCVIALLGFSFLVALRVVQ